MVVCQNCIDTALPLFLSNIPAKCKVDLMNGSLEYNIETDRYPMHYS